VKKVELAIFGPFLFLVLIWVLFFQKFFLKSLLPIPADIITGMYYPWLDYKWGYEVGVPVRNPILSDTVSQFWIWRNWAIDHLKQGEIAIWSPYSLAGYPLSPWFHTILFSPANIFYFLTDKLTAMGFVVSFQLLAALVFMFLFLYKLTQNRIASAFGAISFSFSAFFIGWLTWGTVGWTAAFLPLSLLFVRKIIRVGFEAKYILGFIFSLVFSLLGGHPQTFFYVLLIVVIYLFGLWQRKIARTGEVVFVLLLIFLSLLLAAPVIFPSIQIIRHSIRGMDEHIRGVDYGFLPVTKLIILLFAPNFFGNPANGNYWGEGYNFQEYLGWFGSSALFLAIFSFWIYISSTKRSRSRECPIFLVIFLIGILGSLKYPLGFLIYKLNIPLLSTSSAARALFISTFAGAILASLGLKEFIGGQFEGKTLVRTFYSFLVLVGGIIIGLSLSYKLFTHAISPDDMVYAADFLRDIRVALRNLILPTFSMSVALVLAVFVYYFRAKRWFLRMAASFLILVALLEGVYFGWRYTPFVERHMYFPDTPVIKFLKKASWEDKDFFRIEREKGEILPANMWMPYGFCSASGYDPVYPRSFADFLIEKKVRKGYSRYVDLSRNETLLDYLGVKYFLVLKRDEKGKVSEKGNIPYQIDNKKWEIVFEDKTVAVLRNQSFFPPYLLIDKNNNTMRGNIVLLEKKDSFWRFRVETKKRGLFVLLENYFPGWRVKVDGIKEDLVLANGGFKGVKVEPGLHEIFFYYRNNFLRLGIMSSMTSVLIIGFLIYKFKGNNLVNSERGGEKR